MQFCVAARSQSDLLFLRGEAGHVNRNQIFADGHSVELESALVVAGCSLRPARICGMDGDLRASHRAVLWVMNQSTNRTENSGARKGRKQQQAAEPRDTRQVH